MSLKKAMSSSLLCLLTMSGDATPLPLASDLMMADQNERGKPCRGEQKRCTPASSVTASRYIAELSVPFCDSVQFTAASVRC